MIITILMFLTIAIFSFAGCINSQKALKQSEIANNISQQNYEISNLSYQKTQLMIEYLTAGERPQIDLSGHNTKCVPFKDYIYLNFILTNYGKRSAECTFEISASNLKCYTENDLLEEDESKCSLKETIYFNIPEDFKFRIDAKKELETNKEISLNINYSCKEPLFNFNIPSKKFTWNYPKEKRKIEDKGFGKFDIYYKCE